MDLSPFFGLENAIIHVYSDEPRFCLDMYGGRVERRDSSFAMESFMVWDAIVYSSRSPLVFINGNVMSQRHSDDFSEPYFLPYIRRYLNFLEASYVNLLLWPPRSSDFSPIEDVWDMMGKEFTSASTDVTSDSVHLGWDDLIKEWVRPIISF